MCKINCHTPQGTHSIRLRSAFVCHVLTLMYAGLHCNSSAVFDLSQNHRPTYDLYWCSYLRCGVDVGRGTLLVGGVSLLLLANPKKNKKLNGEGEIRTRDSLGAIKLENMVKSSKDHRYKQM